MRVGKSWKTVLAVPFVAVIVIGLAGVALTESPQDQKAREIASALACPVCGGLSVADSPAPLAQQMRALIGKKLAQGESRADILQYFVDRYGEGILREPPKSGFNQVLWWLPVIGLVGGMVVLALVIYRWRTRRHTPAPAALSGIPAENLAMYRRRVEEEVERHRGGFSERTRR